MQYQNKEIYENTLQYFNSVDKQQFQQQEFDVSMMGQNLTSKKLSDINLMKSYLPDNNLKQSYFKSSFILINALNIVQQKMRNLKYIFEQRDDDLYGVWLWKQGQQQLIIVDDYVPCKNNVDDPPQLATILSKYEWPIIMEKAIGKQIGFEYKSFNMILNDSIEFYIQMITGSIIKEYEIQSYEELKKRLKDQQNIYYVKYTQDQETYAYVIQLCQNNQQEDQKLIKLIAHNEQSVFWKGRQKQDSSCYLTWQEFQQYFYTLYVVSWKDEYRVNSIILQNPVIRKSDFIEHTYCYKFTIENSSNYQVTLWQNNLINQDEDNLEIKGQIKLGLIRMLLFKQLNQNQYKFIDGYCGFENNISIQTQIDVGEYCVFCQGYFNNYQNYTEEQQQVQFQLNLSIKGSQVPINIDSDYLDQEKQIRLIRCLIKHNVSNENRRSFNNIGQPQIYVITRQMFGLLYFYYENRGTIDIKEEIEFIQMGYLLKYESLKKQTIEQVDIKQNNFKILLYTIDPKIILQNVNPNFEYQYKYQLIKEQLENKNSDIIQSEEFDEIVKYQKQEELDQILQNEFTKMFDFDKIKAYILQHNQGIVMDFHNISDNDIQVELKFTKLENLCVTKNEHLIVNEQSIKFTVKNQSKFFLFFDLIDSATNYNFKMTLESSIN